MKPLPTPLIETRPALADQDVAEHPANGPAIGPPPKRYTRGVHDEIVRNIERGNRPPVAAAAAGIPATTFYAWMKRGREGDPHLWEFAEDVERAMAVAESKAVASLAGPEGTFEIDSENAKWWLERSRPEGYSKDTHAKVNALLSEFMENLERNLPPEIFRMVVMAGSGHALAKQKTSFQLTDGGEEEDSEPA